MNWRKLSPGNRNFLLRVCALCASIAVAASLSGCAGYFSQGYDYKPTSDSAAKLSVDQAQQIVSNTLSHCYDSNNRYINFLGYRTDAIGTVAYYPDHLAFTNNSSGKGYSVFYQGMKNLRMTYVAQQEWPDYFVLQWDGKVVNTYLKKQSSSMDGSCNMVYPNGPLPFGSDAKVVMDALLRLKMNYDSVYGPAGEAQFKKAADAYLVLKQKPALPDEVQTYAIQAETAVKQKNLETAARLYEQALQIAPWWPQGRFNHALVLGAIGCPDAASVEMGRYLYLWPDAPNAAAARRKIAEWGTPAY